MNKVNFKKKSNKKGFRFYFALFICIISLGVAAYTTYDSISRFAGKDDNIIASKNQQKYVIQEKNDDVSIQKSQNNYLPNNEKVDSNREKELNEKNLKNAVTTNTKSSGVVVYPTSKNIIKKYSADVPIFSKTLNDWRTHNGIDLAADQGSKVKSIADGKVKEIYNDSMYGTTMVIDHDGGITAYYSGLGKTTLVKMGDCVEVGAEIASINNIPCESADGHHLHLSIKENGKFVDPLKILGS